MQWISEMPSQSKKITVTFRYSRLMNIWSSMLNRCYKKNNNSYVNYGSRGIKVCNQWKESFSSFAMWSLCNGYQEGLTIDRRCVNDSYGPRTCRWITHKEQQSNRTNNINITLNGITKTCSQWAKAYDIPQRTLYHRYHKGVRGENLFNKVNNNTGEKHIFMRDESFRVTIKRKDIKYQKNFKTIEEAIKARDKELETSL